MAAVGAQHGPKLRSRKHGAAIPLDELDKRLLNLMQGAFPIAHRPYAQVASQAGMTEDEVHAILGRNADRAKGNVRKLVGVSDPSTLRRLPCARRAISPKQIGGIAIHAEVGRSDAGCANHLNGRLEIRLSGEAEGVEADGHPYFAAAA